MLQYSGWQLTEITLRNLWVFISIFCANSSNPQLLLSEMSQFWDFQTINY